MARLFDISNMTDTLTIMPGGSARLVYSVSNTTQRPQRGTLKPRLVGIDDASWVHTVGDSERDFGPGSTHQVELDVKVPPGTQPGLLKVRLDAMSVNNPDDDFTEGPTISLKVEAPPLPPPPNRRWLWLVLALIALIVIGAVAYLAMRKPHPGPEPEKPADLPNVVGQPFESAQSQLAHLSQAALQVRRVEQPITDDCPGKVLASDPPAGQPVAKGSTVTLTVGSLPYGPDTCRQGFVWREAFEGDHVCVTPDVRAQAAQDNALARARVSPFGGPYGPNTCLPGFVWRDARQGDHICVPPGTRTAAATDNQQAISRKACQQ